MHIKKAPFQMMSDSEVREENETCKVGVEESKVNDNTHYLNSSSTVCSKEYSPVI